LNIFDLSGRRFGRLTVVGFHGRSRSPSGNRRYKWVCRCDCGNASIVDGWHLRSSTTKSCGCLQRDVMRKLRTAHGATAGGRETTEFTIWKTMIQRCDDPNCKSFRNYGGRGITVCDRWRKFENFLADMGERPKGLTLERKDVNGPYKPENCRWATWSEQARNRRDSIVVTHCGRDMPLKTACEVVGLDYHTVWQRINRCGWSVERALGGGT